MKIKNKRTASITSGLSEIDIEYVYGETYVTLSVVECEARYSGLSVGNTGKIKLAPEAIVELIEGLIQLKATLEGVMND